MARRRSAPVNQAKAKAKAKIDPEQEVDAMVARVNSLTKDAGRALLPPDNMDQAFILMQQIELIAPKRAEVGWKLYFDRFEADLGFQAACERGQMAALQEELSRVFTLIFI